MSFFIDTNIALGYTIIHDSWHEMADKFILNVKEYSDLCRSEMNFTKKELSNLL